MLQWGDTTTSTGCDDTGELGAKGNNHQVTITKVVVVVVSHLWCDLLAAVASEMSGDSQEWVGHCVVHLYQLKGSIQTQCHDEDDQVPDLDLIE